MCGSQMALPIKSASDDADPSISLEDCIYTKCYWYDDLVQCCTLYG